MKLSTRVRRGWNAFRSHEEKRNVFNAEENYVAGPVSYYRPDRNRYYSVSGKDVTNSIYTTFSVDAANVDMKHVKVDKNGLYIETVNSTLNQCLTVEANIDQSGWALRQDIFYTLLKEGHIALVPIDTDEDPEHTDGFTIQTMRVGLVTRWMSTQVIVRLFREETQQFEEIKLPKSAVALPENPFYTVMNETNSTLKRLTRKMALMDQVDEQIGSGKLDLIIQLPYIVKNDTKKKQAEKRRADLEEQLNSSNYGVAYADGTEKVIQLNRPVENNLQKNVDALMKQLYDELGTTPEVLNGTASEETMLNYQNRITKPLLRAVTDEMKRKFLSKTARTQGHSIEFFLNPFSLVRVSKIAEIADKFIRNEILTANEIRGIVGFVPSTDEKANKLYNPNMPAQEQPGAPVEQVEVVPTPESTTT